MGNVCSESTAGMKQYWGEDAVMYWKEREVVSSVGKSFTAWLRNASALCLAVYSNVYNKPSQSPLYKHDHVYVTA